MRAYETDMLERSPRAYAVVSPDSHKLVYANPAFYELPGIDRSARIGDPIRNAIPWAARSIADVLRRVAVERIATCNHSLGFDDAGIRSWNCNVWPTSETPNALMMIDVYPSIRYDATMQLQREIAERLLLAALRASDSADKAHSAEVRAEFLADVGESLAASLDPATTERTIAHLAIPTVAEWCIVDILSDDGSMRRLAIVHRDPHVQSMLEGIQERWQPRAGDAFGIPAIRASVKPVELPPMMNYDFDVMGYDADVVSVLRELAIGALLTTPLVSDGVVFGAVTFVARGEIQNFSAADIALAEALGRRSSFALARARTYAEMLLAKKKVQDENAATSDYLRSIGHELRTPLQAIAGYAEIISCEIHGPITADQRVDLDRIVTSQRHVLVLVSELMEYMRTGHVAELVVMPGVSIDDALASASDVIEPLLTHKSLRYSRSCPDRYRARADAIKLHQILLNLLSNAVKFTEEGGEISVSCARVDSSIEIRVQDTGRGIDAEMLERIFEPFVQAEVRDGLAGLGLGLAISRDLARRMSGELAVQSSPGNGSTFVLTLPFSD